MNIPGDDSCGVGSRRYWIDAPEVLVSCQTSSNIVIVVFVAPLVISLQVTQLYHRVIAQQGGGLEVTYTYAVYLLIGKPIVDFLL